MSTRAIRCQQCDESIVVDATTSDLLRAELDQADWAPFGSGVTPFAEENAARGEFTCPRCSSEGIDQRLHRIAARAIEVLGIQHSWLVVRTGESSVDHFRVMAPEGTVQVEFEHRKSDQAMLDVLCCRLTSALGLQT